MDNRTSFYEYQHDRFGILLGWGVINTIVGLVMSRSNHETVKQVGMQAAAWGAIDAVLAWFGRRGATRAQAKWESGELGGEDETKAARGFRRILLINAGLDVGYMLGGVLLQQRSDRADRRGMGAGIILQGLFLFLYDGLLGKDVGSRFGNR